MTMVTRIPIKSESVSTVEPPVLAVWFENTFARCFVAELKDDFGIRFFFAVIASDSEAIQTRTA